MTDFHEYLERAHWAGTGIRPELAPLTPDEVAAVAAELARPSPRVDPSVLIETLGYSHAVRHRPLVERFLDSPDDPFAAIAALEALVDSWELGDNYIDCLARFIDGVEWDQGEDVRMAAISLAGGLLRDGRGTMLLPMIAVIAEDDAEDAVTRAAAHEALARAAGQGWDEIPTPQELVAELERRGRAG